MSSANAKLSTDVLTFLILIYCFLIFSGKIPFKKKNDFLEKNKKLFIGGTALGILYYMYIIADDIFQW